MTSACIKNFLFRNINNFDISKIYPDIIVNRLRDISAGVPYEQILAYELGGVLSGDSGYPYLLRSKDQLKKAIKLNRFPVEFDAQIVVGGQDHDIQYSLNKHTLNIKGEISDAAYVVDLQKWLDPFWQITLTPNSEWRLYDRYDWSDKPIFITSGSFLEIANRYFPNMDLYDRLGSDRFNQINNLTAQSIRDIEGRLLQDNGFGHPFDINGQFVVKAPVVFKLDPSVIN